MIKDRRNWWGLRCKIHSCPGTCETHGWVCGICKKFVSYNSEGEESEFKLVKSWKPKNLKTNYVAFAGDFVTCSGSSSHIVGQVKINLYRNYQIKRGDFVWFLKNPPVTGTLLKNCICEQCGAGILRGNPVTGGIQINIGGKWRP